MKIDNLHSWDLSPQAAVDLQRDLAPRLVDNAPLDLRQIHTVAGVDVSVRSGLSRAAVVVMRLARVGDRRNGLAQPRRRAFPTSPACWLSAKDRSCWRRCGNYNASPMPSSSMAWGRFIRAVWASRRIWACGWGALQLAVANRITSAIIKPPADIKGARSPLTHRGEALGVVLRTRVHVKPIYVSVGHLADIESAVELTLRCTTRFRLPEPIRAAHKAAAWNTPPPAPPRSSQGGELRQADSQTHFSFQ